MRPCLSIPALARSIQVSIEMRHKGTQPGREGRRIILPNLRPPTYTLQPTESQGMLEDPAPVLLVYLTVLLPLSFDEILVHL